MNREFSNDYVSEPKLSLFRFGLERELVVHLVVGIHVAYVVVVDQGHVTKFINSTNEAVNHVASRVSTQIFFKSVLIFTIVNSTA